jgi:hypothetical protein
MTANPIVLLPFLISSSICLIAPVDSSLYLLNLFDTFLQIFVRMIQNRHDDRMKWYKLTGIGASRNVELVQRQPPKHAQNDTVFYLIDKVDLLGFEPTTSATFS